MDPLIMAAFILCICIDLQLWNRLNLLYKQLTNCARAVSSSVLKKKRHKMWVYDENEDSSNELKIYEDLLP